MNVLLVRYGFYATIMRREADALSSRGDRVDVLCLRGEGQKKNEKINKVSIRRIMRRKLNERRPVDYLFKQIWFFFLSFFMITVLFIRKRYDIIHVYTIPDYEVFAGVIPKLFGSRIILDIIDILPEFYVCKFGVNENSIIVKWLKLIEKLSTKFADHVITVTEIWKDTLASRSIPESKCTVLLNVPDEQIFDSIKYPYKVNPNYFTLSYTGHLGIHSGVDTVIKAINILKEEIPSIRFNIYGKGQEAESFKKLISDLKLNKFVNLDGVVPVTDVPKIMSCTDVGIDPKKSGIYADDTLSMKILEFFTMGVPVIASKRKAIQMYLDESMIVFFKSDDERDLADRIRELYNNLDRRKELSINASKFVKKYNWSHYRRIYLDLIDSL